MVKPFGASTKNAKSWQLSKRVCDVENLLKFQMKLLVYFVPHIFHAHLLFLFSNSFIIFPGAEIHILKFDKYATRMNATRNELTK